MVYALLAVVVIQCFLLVYQGQLARRERSELEDRLMAVTQPVALIQHKAHQDDTPGDVTYVDEAREAELSPSWMA